MWMYLEMIQTEWSQSDEKKTNIIWYYLYLEPKDNINKFIYKTKVDSKLA